jgi:enamine deaminase RidA (YjgF/YER057c/UK114 family)
MLQKLQPEGWAKPLGYANGMMGEGRHVFVAGQIGWNAQSVFESDDFVAQTRQALQNVVDVLKVAGAGPEHVASMTWYVTNKREYLDNVRDVGKAWRETMGKNFPAMAVVQVTALMEDRAKIEIQAHAII